MLSYWRMYEMHLSLFLKAGCDTLGKPPHFDGEDYGFWSHKMRSHLFSLHHSIWEIVDSGMHFDSSDSHIFINEQIHKNAQATTVLLASLCRELRVL